MRSYYNNIAFTLIEVLIVVLIIGLILAIVLPNYFKMTTNSKKTICINNLRNINSAIDQWVLEDKIEPGTVPSGNDENTIYGYVKGGAPRCPSGGTYAIHAVGSEPQVTCSREGEGHSI